jgi:hypothetical protein
METLLPAASLREGVPRRQLTFPRNSVPCHPRALEWQEYRRVTVDSLDRGPEDLGSTL